MSIHWFLGVTDYEFIVRFTKFNVADPRWRMKFSKMTIKSVQNVYLWVFEVADCEFVVIFRKFNMADLRWWMTFWHFAIFFKINDHLLFQQRVLKVTEFYSERRGNWHMSIQCSDFLHQFLFNWNNKFTDRKI